MTGLKAIIVYILMVEGIGIFSLPEPDTTAEKFKKLLDPKTDRTCIFPPAIALLEENVGLCLENNNQEDRPTAKTVCYNILELTDLVCGLKNFSIPIIDVMIFLEVSQEDLCSSVEIRHLFTEEKCSDIVQTESAFRLVRLYSAMLKGLFKTFAGNDNLTTLHSVIQHLHKYFPFPPRGSEDKGNFLQKCENDGVPEPTHGLCLQVRDLATEYASNHWFGVFDGTLMFLNVSKGTWDPCPVLAERNEFFKDKCDIICGAENVVICRSLAYGYIHKPIQEVAKTETFPTHTADTTTEKHVDPQINHEKPTFSPGKTTEVSPDPDKTPKVSLDPTNVPKGSSGSTMAPGINLVSSKTTNVNAIPVEKIVSSTIPSKNLESSPDTGKEHNGTTPDNKTTEDQYVNGNKEDKTTLSPEENKYQRNQTSSGEMDQKNNANQTDILNDNDKALTSKTTLSPSTSVSTRSPSTSVSTDQDTSPGVTSNMSDVDDLVNDDLSDVEDNDKIDIGIGAGKMYENVKTESKPLDSQITQDDTGGISFMSYFLVFVVLCVAGYILFHNKQKIIALVIEGKNTQHGRRPSSKDYNRLKTDDVMPSLEKSASSSNYVY